MYFVYVISSKTKKYLYVGITDNIERRVKQHNAGLVKSSHSYRPFVLLHTESVSDRIEARKREKQLKSGYGKEWLKEKYRIT